MLTKWNYNALDEAAKQRICRRPLMESGPTREAVSAIIGQVRQRGDQAVLDYTEKWDGVRPDPLLWEVRKPEKIPVSRETLDSFRLAADNLTRFHRAQIPEKLEIETMPGIVCRREWRPIERVGLYVPGGSAPLPSTALMLGIPALLAGCSYRIMATPPDREGRPLPEIELAAALAGIPEIYLAGGAQAVAAMAWGTSSVKKTDKIFGPGNQYVTAAKLVLQNSDAMVSIDMPAGPSEVMVVADGSASPAFIASDLLSQAEHGPDSQVMLIAMPGLDIAEVDREIEKQLQELPRAATARKALAYGHIIKTDSTDQSLEMVNRYAPEHLILQMKEADRFAASVQHAGSVFIGPWTPESVGDYASGTNHTLPTYGYARMYSGVSVDSFIKYLTFQKLDRHGLEAIAPAVTHMAAVEQLEAHRRAVTIRLDSNIEAKEKEMDDDTVRSGPDTGGFNLDHRVRANIRKLKPYHAARDDYHDGMLLDANENSFGPVLPVSEPLHRYPDTRLNALRSKWARFRGLEMDQVFVGVGSDEAIDLLMRLFGTPGRDEIIITPPTYGMYSVSAQINDIGVVEAPLTRDFRLVADSVLDKTGSRTSMIMLCSPNNPTGNTLDQSAIEKILAGFSGPVVVDEAYVDFSTQGSLSPLLERYPNLVILQTLSKSFGLAAIRLGAALGHPRVIEWMMKVKAPYNVNRLTAGAALEAFNHTDRLNSHIKAILSERERLAAALSELSDVDTVFPSDANFLLVRFREALSIYRKLAERGIIVRYRGDQLHCESTLRITIGTPEENDRLLNELSVLTGRTGK